jgi:hypothetical protein
MNRPDLIKKYVEETGNCLELLEKLLDFSKTNLEVLKYIEWLEWELEIIGYKNTKLNLGNSPDYIQETANNVVKLRFINEVKSMIPATELMEYNEKYKTCIENIPANLYSKFLELLKENSLNDVIDFWIRSKIYKK